MNKSNLAQRNMTVKTIIPFLVITFGLSWGIAALVIFFTDQVVAIFGEITNRNPLYIIMAYSPGIAGTFLVWRHYGLRGLGSFFRRMTLWRMPLVWWLFLIIGVPSLAYIAAALNGTIGDPFPFSPWYEVFPALLQSLFLLGTMEEFGWRGILQPLLQRKMAPIWAGLIVGIIWATWHLPAFLFGGGVQYSAWPVVPFFGGVIAALRHPHAHVQQRPRQPIGRFPVSLSDDESHFPRWSTLGQPHFRTRGGRHRGSKSADNVQEGIWSYRSSLSRGDQRSFWIGRRRRN